MTSDMQIIQLSDITDDLISEFGTRFLPSKLDVLKRLLFKT